jgi:adenine nucleotide transporter 17
MSDSVIHAAAGAAGGIVAMSITYPLQVLSTRAAIEKKNHSDKSAYQTATDILKKEGPMSLYNGLTSSLLGIAITNGVYYYFYEGGRSAIINAPSRSSDSKGMTTLESMFNGWVAGSATSIVSNPIWVVQTQQAVKASQIEKAKAEGVVVPKKLSLYETVQDIVQKGGFKALWAGIGPALVLVINPILQYTAFEQLKNLLMVRRTTRLRASGSNAAAALTELDFFFLGALSKLIATSLTYPYIVIKSRLQAGQENYSAIEGIRGIIKNEGIKGLYKGIESKLLQSVLTAAILFAGQKKIFDLTKAALAPVLVK